MKAQFIAASTSPAGDWHWRNCSGLLFLSAVCVAWTLCRPRPMFDPRFKWLFHVPSSGKIHFCILSCKASMNRTQRLINSWDWPFTHWAVSGVTFISLEDKELLAQYRSVKVPESYNDLYRLKTGPRMSLLELVIKLVFAMEYCVNGTRADWCYRGMDDVYINREGFEEFMLGLKDAPNPRKMLQVYGNCNTCSWVLEKWYLQGGAGYLFSRKAAQVFATEGREWISQLTTARDDWVLSQFLVKHGIQSRDADSGYFTGHFMPRKEWARFNWSDPKHFPWCPAGLQPEGQCDHRLYSYHKAAFVHSYPDYVSPSEWEGWFKDMPRDAMFYYRGIGFHICRARAGQLKIAPKPWRAVSV